MKRHALLLGSTRGEVSLPAVRNDLGRIFNYLNDVKGGAWEPSEITHIINPTRACRQ